MRTDHPKRYGDDPMKAAEPGAMQGNQAKSRTTFAVFAVAGFVLLAFLATLVLMIVIFATTDTRPEPSPEPAQPQRETPYPPQHQSGEQPAEHTQPREQSGNGNEPD